MKKIIALLLILVVSVFIRSNVYADSNGKITINNAVSGETYKIYKIFDLEGYNKTTGAYTYKLATDSPWRNFFTNSGDGASYVSIDSQNYVTATSSLTTGTAAAFAKLALQYASDNSITATGSATASSAKVEFSSLPLGYYLVDTTLGTLCILNTTDNEVSVSEKNTVPTVTNTVKEGSTYGSTMDAKIGDKVDFKSTINAYKGAQEYELLVTLGNGLTYDSTTGITVKVGDTTIASSNYTITTSGIDETFKITFTDEYLNTITGTSASPTEIEVTYSATLNSSATISNGTTATGNSSQASLTYSENGDSETSTSTALVYTWSAPVFKYYLSSSVKTGLENAVFVVSTSTNVSDAIYFVNSGTNYRVALSSESSKATDITTGATGKFTIQGLDQGTYYLIEKTAPTGYNKLSAAVPFKIESSTQSNTMTETVKSSSDGTTFTTVGSDGIEVENKTGTILPDTGGIGTKIFICVGSILFITAGVILVSKKRLYNAG